MEISQSQELEGNAMKKQTPTVIHTTLTIPMVIFDIDWFPRYTKKKIEKIKNH